MEEDEVERSRILSCYNHGEMTNDQMTNVQNFLLQAKKPLLAILGPTASGKTALAVKLAQKCDGEIINADSRQIYQEIHIGNALPTETERGGIPHHLFSITPLSYRMTVAEYKTLAEKTIDEILARGKIPILCGGTMFWTDAVIENFQIPKGEPDHEWRKEQALRPVDDLLEELRDLDQPEATRLGKSRNKRYIIRALEIAQKSGSTKTALAKKGPRKYDVYKIGIQWEREALYQRINERTRAQLDSGLIEEVKGICDRFAEGDPDRLAALNWPSLTSIGVKEVMPYLKGEISRDQLLVTLSQHNRNYAKRQLTWYRKDKEIRWVGNS